MKVIFAVLVVLISLTMAKGNAIDIAWKLLCKLNKENPGKMNEVKECDTKIFGERADWLPDAIRKCEKAEFPTDSLDEFLNEMCREEREADVQEMKMCVGEKYAELHVDPESIIIEAISKCL
ncbi:uncharacterized protein LOC143225305 [Tachypleus tridentatus]|uniref:uncharacterized protein LOC143225305 n=1 Tax=Tachypleus tridentatus TaxID=6853 RepID=UPI003FCF25CD